MIEYEMLGTVATGRLYRFEDGKPRASGGTEHATAYGYTVIVVAGEALIDLIGESDGRYRALPGGSPANVAVGLARLGIDTQLLARLGTGRFGEIVQAHLASNGVGLKYAVKASQPATIAVASADESGQASYDFYLDGTADWAWHGTEVPDPLPAGTVSLFVGSLAMVIEPASGVLTDLIAREHLRGDATVVLDPNIRPAVLPSAQAWRARIEWQLPSVDVVKVSDQDVAWLAPNRTVEQVAADWLDRGPQLVVVTLGGHGAYAVTGEGIEARVPAIPVDVVDTVGAGDAFSAGLIHALARRNLLGGPDTRETRSAMDAATLSRILEHANRAAAITCTRHGADPPTGREVGLRGPEIPSDTLK